MRMIRFRGGRILRTENHPIIGSQRKNPTVRITMDDESIEAIEGEPIAAALMAAGKIVFRYTHKLHEPRGVFCAVGRCSDCMMIVDGTPNVRTCVTPVREGMMIETQYGRGPRIPEDHEN